MAVLFDLYVYLVPKNGRVFARISRAIKIKADKQPQLFFGTVVTV